MINYRSCQNKSSFRISYDFHSCPSPIFPKFPQLSIVVETLLDRTRTSRRGFPELVKSGSLFCFLVEIFSYLFLGSNSDSFHVWGCLRSIQLETRCYLKKVVRSGNRISVDPWTQHQQQQQHHHQKQPYQEQYRHHHHQKQQLVLMDNNTTARSPIITGGALKTSAPAAAVVDSGSVSYVSSKEPLPYDPMLGWYTAATLSGLLFLFLACVGLEKLKDKIVTFFEKQSPVSATGKLFDDDVADVVKPLQRKSTGGENRCLESDALLGAAGSGGGGGAIDYRNCSSADNYVYLTLDRPNCLRLTHDEFASQPCDMQTEFGRADDRNDEIMTNRISEESEENVQMLLQQQQQQQQQQGHQLQQQQHHQQQQSQQQQQFQLQQHPQPQSVKIEIVEVHTETPSYGDSPSSYGDSPASYGELSPAVMNDAMNESTV